MLCPGSRVLVVPPLLLLLLLLLLVLLLALQVTVVVVEAGELALVLVRASTLAGCFSCSCPRWAAAAGDGVGLRFGWWVLSARPCSGGPAAIAAPFFSLSLTGGMDVVVALDEALPDAAAGT